jgi:hypothetical protein
LSRTTALVSISRMVVSAPMRSAPPLSEMPARLGIFLMLTRQPGSSLYLMSTITSVPPAITLASLPCLDNSVKASLIDFGSKYSIIVTPCQEFLALEFVSVLA